MVVFDASMLLLLLSPTAAAPRDSKGVEIDGVQERVAYLVEQLEKTRTKIIVPTPALSEILVRVGTAGPDYLRLISGSASFKVVPFDQRAAVEVALLTKSAIDGGDKRGGSQAPWAKVKYDRQIIAIAKIEAASTIYSDDGDIRALAGPLKLNCIGTADLPLRPEERQKTLNLGQPAHRADGHTQNDRQIAAATEVPNSSS